MDAETDLYAILGVSPTSEDVVIKAAYRALMRHYHPDMNSDPSAIDRARRINEAYETLGDKSRRTAYDTSRARGSGDECHQSSRRSHAERGAGEQVKPKSSPQAEVERQNISKGNGMAAVGAFAALGLLSFAVFVAASRTTAEPTETAYIEDSYSHLDGPLVDEDPFDVAAYDLSAEAAELEYEEGSLEPNEQRALSGSPDPISFSTVEAGAHRFSRVMSSSGLRGARSESERCHEAQRRSPTWDGLDSCAAFDFAAAALSRTVGSSLNRERNAYFEFQSQNQADYYQPYHYLATARLDRIKSSAETAHTEKLRNTPPPRHRPEPKLSSKPTQEALVTSLIDQVRPHWHSPQEIGVSELATHLSFQLAPDGSLIGKPRVVGQKGLTAANSYLSELHAEMAVRAVEAAAPFDLPPDQYETWKTVTSLRFDSKS
ncbi:J domain-containing protein [Altererythrobacter sp. SALINAS58]|uniref:J domain-containing protein n=1 Tax=Alteripontixanthobacter muriae TaxID=2705546 RepID=UPI0015752B42|nr:J domain-containing protein [Alteripontixanthobacter muriae]NTZ42118.1 J domain-containing protein [Alteripontixanthobacter muriae]